METDNQNKQEEAQGAEVPTGPKARWWKNIKIKIWLPLVFWMLLIIIGAVWVNFFPGFFKFKTDYAQAYVLVNDKISQDAAIVVNIPPNIKKTDLWGQVAFEPELKGDWRDDPKNEKQIFFKPAEKMELGKYYTVKASTSQGVMSKDFLVDEDPRVVSVFPKSDSEANERSKITVTFNRPMVALTVLNELTDKDIPIEITPETPGEFKWISTRVLQFIPKNGLINSSNYLVKVKSNFVSMDGLNIENFEHKFITRPLRYDSIDELSVIFNKPLALRLNQPVDLERTKAEISVTSSSTRENIEFVAEYGQTKIFNKEKGKDETTEDESMIYVYQKKDKFGREKFWDFNTDYSLHINKAYPKSGDINLEEARDSFFSVGNILSSISATSDQTSFAGQDLFDPKGALILNFYEDIDLAKSDIKSDKLTKTVYDKKCQGASADMETSSDVECQKIDDKSKILVYFDSQAIKTGEILKLDLVKIVNTDGIKLNSETITKNIMVYGEPKIVQVWPDKHLNADLTSVVVCTNNPIRVQDKKDFKKYFSANLDFEINSWDAPYYVEYPQEDQNYHCQPGTYENHFGFGFMPESNYELTMKLVDDFGQTVEKKVNFHTEKMPQKYLNFYHYQEYYSVTTPSKTRLTYAAENMDFIDVHVCKLSPANMLYYMSNKPDYWKGPEAIKGCLETATKRIDLPKKYWIKNYFHMDLKDLVKNPLGQYVITITNPNYFDRSNEPRRVWERNYLTVTNLSVVEKRNELQNNGDNPDSNLSKADLAKTKSMYWVTEIGSLKPVAGAKISLYSGQHDGINDIEKLTLAGNYTTDSQGLVYVPAINNLNSFYVEMGDDSAIVDSDIEDLNSASSAYNAQQIYLYTDKPIYRPGQTVYFKGLYRVGFDGNYEIFKDKKIPVTVYSANNSAIWTGELDVNDFGSFNAEFKLDDASPLGQYRIEAKGSGYAYFDVEEYKGAAFKLDVKTDKEEYISPDTFNLDVNASYYFGAPVDSGEVEYSVTSQDYYFSKYQDEYFSFGRGWYNCWDNCSYGDKFIMRGKANLDASGKVRLSQAFDIAQLFKKDEEKNSKIFTVFVTVKNSSGQSVSNQASFVMHAGDFYLGLNTDKNFMSKNSPFQVKLKSVDTEGKPLSVSNINLKLNRIKWIYAQRQEVDGAYYYQWERRLELVEEKKVNTDGNGNWNSEMKIDKEGEYELDAEGIDKKGNKIFATYSIYVYGETQVEVKPTNDTSLELVANKTDVKIGDMASFIIKSPFKKAKALVTIERGQIYEYKIIDIDQSLYKYEFPIKPNYAPNVYVSVVLLSPDPDIKFGSLSYSIDTEKQSLNIDVKSDKKVYLPGEEVILKFSAKDSDGKGVETEFSAAVVDMSVLALKGNPQKDPLVFFYSGFPLTISTISNLKNKLFEADVPVGTKGGGGNEPEDLARKKRGIFKETAFWQAVIKTDANGEAEVKFTLPDNLTTWQAESIGITRDTKLGVNYLEFMTKKNIMATPLAPRFIIPGDEFYVGATVFNQTDKDQTLSVTLTSSTLTLPSNIKEDIFIKAGASKTIYFLTKAPIDIRQGNHVFTVSVKNDQFEDTVEGNIPVRRNQTAEVVALSDRSADANVNEYVFLPNGIEKDQGELTINTSASLASFMSNGLNSVINYAYDSNPDIIAKLKAIAIIKKGLGVGNFAEKYGLKDIMYNGSTMPSEKFVQIAQAKLYANYKQEGFTYYAGGVPDFYLSVDALDALINLKQAGYEINYEFLNELYRVVNDQINYDEAMQNNSLQQILAVYILTKIDGPAPLNPVLIEAIKKMEKNEKLLNEELSQTSINYLAILLSNAENLFGKNFKEKVLKILMNRVNFDSRGAFVSPNDNFSWEYYETPIQDTALTLYTFSKNKQGNDVVDRMMRWLDRNRDQDGAWGSLHNTISVIEAMTEYINWQKEDKPNFSLQVSVNPETKNTYTFTKENWADKYSMTVPIGKLPFNQLSTVNFAKTDKAEKNNFYYDISLKYYLPIEEIAPRDEGFAINRNFFEKDDTENKKVITSAKVGDIIRGHLQIFVPKDSYFVAIEDFIPAGFELVNFNLNTEDQSLLISKEENNSTPYNWEKYWYDADSQLWPDNIENHDDRLYAFKQFLPAGTYEYDYYLRALVPGTFHHLPARVSQIYFPENFGRTGGDFFTVSK